MNNISKPLIIIFISSILAINYLGFNAPVNSIKMNSQEDNTIKVLSVPKSSGYTITEKWNSTVASGILNLVEISDNGEYIVLANGTGVTFFQKDRNSTIWTYNSTNGNEISDLKMSDNGEYIVAAEDEQVYLLNKYPETSKTVVWKYPNIPSSAGFEADISANGEYIAVGNSSGHVSVLNKDSVAPKSYIWEVELSGAIGDIAISGDGYYTVAIDAGGYVYLFNKTTTTTCEWSYDTTNPGVFVAISKNGQYFLAANDNNEVYLFNTTNPQGFMWNFTYTPGGFVFDAAISDDGTNIVMAYEDLDEKVAYFNNTPSSGLKQPMWIFNLDELSAWGMAVDISADGEYIVASHFKEDTLFFLNRTGTSPKLYEWSDMGNYFSDAAISDDGRYFVAIDNAKTLYLFHHDIPLQDGGGYISPEDDDDDDDGDDDETGLVVVVVVIIIVSVGGIVIVIIVLIKKGVIDISKIKRE